MTGSPDPTHPPEPFPVRVRRIEWEAEGVISVEFRRPDGSALPSFSAGAHIDLHLPGGLNRSYSLMSDQSDNQRFVIAVGLDAASRGGSVYMHNQLRAGQIIQITGPRNHFPLVENAGKVVLIAGGIGITPLYAMMRRLRALDRNFELHYATRNRQRMAFLADLQQLGAVHPHCDDERGGPLDLASIIQTQPAATHFYCCGPTPMLTAFEQATAHLPAEFVHVEYFSPKPQDPNAASSSFTVVLARSGREYVIPADKTILEVLTHQGMKLDSSCQDGICGTCETRVIEGLPDHRDSVLTKAEQEANKSMMICVSRCKGERLVLDL